MNTAESITKLLRAVYPKLADEVAGRGLVKKLVTERGTIELTFEDDSVSTYSEVDYPMGVPATKPKFVTNK